MLAQNNEIVEQMRLARHLIPRQNGRSRNHRQRISRFPVARDEPGCFFHFLKAVLLLVMEEDCCYCCCHASLFSVER